MRLVALLMGLWLGSLACAADPNGVEMRIFQLNNRPAGATVDMVRQVLTPQGSVLPEERLNKLIVRDTPEALQRVADLLTQIDQPAPQVRIHLTYQGDSPGSGQVLAAGATSPVVATVGPNGQTRVAPIRTTVAAQSVSSNARVNAQENLLVMSGEKGHIAVGRNLVYVQPYWAYANNLGLVPPGLVFQTVSTGFAVEPMVIGNNVRLKVVPYISYQSPQGPGQIEFAESASTLNLRPGETLMLSSGAQTNSQRQNAFGLILGTTSQQQGRSMAIWVSADIVPDYSK